MMDYVIRDMHDDDLSAVMMIEKHAYSHPWTQDIMQTCLQHDYIARVCINTHQNIIAYAFLQIIHDESHLMNITVAVDYQGLGIGQIMLMDCLQCAESKGAAFMFLEVRQSNQVAKHLYEKFNFHEIAVRKDYYPHAELGREDAIVMVKTLQIIPMFADSFMS